MPNKSTLYFMAGGPGTSKVLDYFTASDAIYPFGSVNKAKGRNNHPVIVYQQFMNTGVDFAGVFPDVSILNVAIYWASNVIVGDVNWYVAFERDNEEILLSGVDLDVDSFSPEKSDFDSCPAVSGMLRKTVITFTSLEADGVFPGEPYRIRVRRDSGTFPDTMMGDAQLFRVVLEGLP